MKVKELIKKLNEFDKDMEVCFVDSTLEELMVTKVELKNYSVTNSFNDRCYQSNDETIISMVTLDGEYLSVEEMKNK